MTPSDLDLWGDFSWWKPEGGYAWRSDVTSLSPARKIPGVPGEGPFLMPRQESALAPYDPELFEKNNEKRGSSALLFCTFADLHASQANPESIAASQASIMAFVNTWGWLGIGEPVGDAAGRPAGRGESLEAWCRAVSELRNACALWQWLQFQTGKVTVELGKDCVFITIAPQGASRKGVEPISRLGIFRQEDENLFKRLDRKGFDPRLAVRAILAQQINHHLAGSVSLRVQLHGEALRPRLRPRTLLAALWAQLFQAVTGSRLFRLCKYCHEPLDVTGHKLSKTTHRDCKNQQKARRYRLKQAERANAKPAKRLRRVPR